MLWLLFFQAGSIWVGWFKTEVLNGSLSNLWTVKPNSKNLWLVSKLIKCRDEIYTWIQVIVGNGQSCRFWTDHWFPMEKVADYLTGHGNLRMGVPQDATLASLNRNGQWLLPGARSERQVSLYAHLTGITLSNMEDNYERIMDGKRSGKYKTELIYQKLKGEAEDVPWAKTVWISGGIPKQSFFTWLVILNRCPTRDRILSWGLQTDTACLLCNQSAESRNHLFFECQYSWAVWKRISERLGFVSSTDWDQLMDQLQHLQGNKYFKRLLLLSWQATMHWLWAERNSRLHRATFRPEEILTRLVCRQIKERLLSYRVTNPGTSSAMLQLRLAGT